MTIFVSSANNTSYMTAIGIQSIQITVQYFQYFNLQWETLLICALKNLVSKQGNMKKIQCHQYPLFLFSLFELKHWAKILINIWNITLSVFYIPLSSSLAIQAKTQIYNHWLHSHTKMYNHSSSLQLHTHFAISLMSYPVTIFSWHFYLDFFTCQF